jgi:hypothetical protein
LSVLTVIAVGAAGVGVAGTVVVMAAGAEARFETEKLNGPPNAPVVVLRTATDAGSGVLVNVHVICAAGNTLAAGTVSTLPASVPKLAGFPVKLALASLHVAEVVEKLGLAPSVTWMAVMTVVT